MASPYFEQEKTCPVCDKKVKTTRVRSSACIVLRRDTDFCTSYKDINPIHYSIIVCPHCQYANLDKAFSEPLKVAEKLRLQKGLGLLKQEIPDLSKERNAELSLKATQLAIQSAQIKQAGPGSIGSLYLRAAWSAREFNNQELELKYIDQARQLYKESFENERLSESKMTECRMMYIIGELHRRAGYYQEAVQWFSRVVTHRNVKREPEIERLARDQWDEAKDQFKKQQKNEQSGQKSEPSETNSATPEVAASNDSTEKTIENPPTPKATRYKSKTYISLYNDQIEWLKNLSNSNYNKTKELLERETLIRAIIDAVIEAGFEIKEGVRSEEELKEKIKEAIVQQAG